MKFTLLALFRYYRAKSNDHVYHDLLFIYVVLFLFPSFPLSLLVTRSYSLFLVYPLHVSLSPALSDSISDCLSPMYRLNSVYRLKILVIRGMRSIVFLLLPKASITFNLRWPVQTHVLSPHPFLFPTSSQYAHILHPSSYIQKDKHLNLPNIPNYYHHHPLSPPSLLLPSLPILAYIEKSG